MKRNTFAWFAGATMFIISAAVIAQPPAKPEPDLLKNLAPRPLGPASMGGRVTDLAIDESHPATFYVATASGGLWKTVNNGTTFKSIFDKQTTISIGDIALASSDPKTIWVGTGEANARNSVSWGDGVYKSADGGETWTNMGLRDSHHIGRIVIHPKDPNIVYIAAVGHFWGPNIERGVFKTADGGKTWKHVLYLSVDCGCIDLNMDPQNPDVVLAAAYQVRRDGFSGGDPALMQVGPYSGVYKTTDGGKTWTRPKGLPDRPMGRIGLDRFRKNPKILWAVVQTDLTNIRGVPGQGAKASADSDTGGIFRSDDGGDSWTKVNDLCPRPFYFGQIRVDPNDDKRVYVLGIPLYVTKDGGKSFTADAARQVHADHHAMWIDPANSEHMIVGCDGGVYATYDRGTTWEFIDNLPLGQFYAAAVDMKPYRVYGGLQDNGTWGGPSQTPNSNGIANGDWGRILGGDGFYCQVDPSDVNIVYCETQYGGLARVNMASGDVRGIRPLPPDKKTQYRFNWSTPVLLSPHDPKTIYYGGQFLFRSLNQGEKWETISPDLTHGGSATISTIAESPARRGIVWVGTDDGKVQRTILPDAGGVTWNDVSDKIPGVPPARTISRIEASHFDAGTAYVSIDRHRNDDHRPYLFKTTDFGQTWKPLHNGLPENGSIFVIREDAKNKDLLLAGTEFGLFISLDGGATWLPFKKGLPTVAVHDLVIHPREEDLIIATHGRSLYVMDITPLRNLTAEVRQAGVALFEPPPRLLFERHISQGFIGSNPYYAANPSINATFWYYLREPAKDTVKFTIKDAKGAEIFAMTGTKEAGLQKVTWGMRRRIQQGVAGSGQLVPPGEYAVTMTIGATSITKKLKVEAGNWMRQ